MTSGPAQGTPHRISLPKTKIKLWYQIWRLSSVRRSIGKVCHPRTMIYLPETKNTTTPGDQNVLKIQTSLFRHLRVHGRTFRLSQKPQLACFPLSRASQICNHSLSRLPSPVPPMPPRPNAPACHIYTSALAIFPLSPPFPSTPTPSAPYTSQREPHKASSAAKLVLKASPRASRTSCSPVLF